MSDGTPSAPRPVRSGAVLMSIAQVVTAVGGFLTSIAVARILGADGLGAYTVALSLLLVLGAISSLGLENGIAWSVAGGRWSPRAALRASQAVALGLGAVGIVVVLAARLAFPDAFAGMSVSVTLIAAAGLPFLISWQYVRWLAVARDRYEAFVVPPALVTVLALALCVAGAVVDDVRGMVIGLTAAHALTAAVALADALRSHPPANGPAGAAPLREATGFGIRASAASALQLLNFRIDLFVLSAVVSGDELGTYATAVSVTSVVFLVPQTLSQIVFPRVAALTADRSLHQQRAIVEAKSLRHVALITLISLPAVAVAMAVAIPLLFGAEFDGAIVLGLILLPGCALFGIASVLAATINGRGFPGYSLRAAAISTPIAFALYAALIPTWGETGAALASTASYAINLAITALYYHRATGDPVAPLLVPTREEIADLRELLRSSGGSGGSGR